MPPDPMNEAIAPAKLNLYLHVTGRRSDGYHVLDSAVMFTAFGDRVRVAPASALSLSISGSEAEGLRAEENLILKAARLLQQHYHIAEGAALTLEKHIPVAAGLGGGSSDAATALRLLNRLWHINAPIRELAELAAPLGADIPACLYCYPLRMQGIGDQLTPLPSLVLPKAIVLVNPRVSLSTAKVYGTFAERSRFSQPADDPTNYRMQTNDLQAPATHLCPLIKNVLAALDAQPGCEMSRLCGSGATCFGIFAKDEQAKAAEQAIRQTHTEWWTVITQPAASATDAHPDNQGLA